MKKHKKIHSVGPLDKYRQIKDKQRQKRQNSAGPSKMIDKSISAIFIAVAGAAFILNIVEIILIIRMRKRWKPFDKMLLSFSFADLLVATVTIVYYVLWLCDVSIRGQKLSQSDFILLLLFSEESSLLHVLFITIDRFYAIRYPIQHNIKMKGRLPNIIIIAVWVYVALISSTLATFMFMWADAFAILAKLYSVTIIALGICYALAYYKMFGMILSHSASVHNVRKCQIRDVLHQDGCKRERGIFITSILVMLSYIICMYPISFEMLIRKKIENISSPTQVFLVTNSLLNPVVYFFKGYCDRLIKNSNRKSSTKQESIHSGTAYLMQRLEKQRNDTQCVENNLSCMQN